MSVKVSFVFSVRRLFLAALGWCAVVALRSHAAIYLDGTDAWISLNNGVYVDATAPFNQNTYAREIASGQAGATSIPMAFTNIPYVRLSGVDYFHVIYDVQETGGNPEVTISSFSISSGSNTIWSLSPGNELGINYPGYTPTFSRLNNGSDLAFYIPLSLFQPYGLVGSNTFVLSWTQIDYDIGADEMVAVGAQYISGSNFGPTDSVQPQGPSIYADPSVVPEPTTLLLGVSGIGMILVFRRRTGRRRKLVR